MTKRRRKLQEISSEVETVMCSSEVEEVDEIVKCPKNSPL